MVLVDADGENPNVAIAYDKEAYQQWGKKDTLRNNDSLNNFLYQPSKKSAQSKEQIIFSDDPKYAHLGDEFNNLIEEGTDDIIVSMPAGTGIETWLDAFDINGEVMSSDRTFDLVCWWISGGSPLSQTKLVEFSKKYPNITTACVLNKGVVLDVPNWERFTLSKELSEIVEAGDIKLVEMLSYKGPSVLQAVASGTPFYEVLEQGIPISGSSYTLLGRITKGGLSNWLKNCWESIKKTGLI